MILVVEDDGEIRESLIDVLSDRGFKVVAVANGREALEFLSSNKTPCLIILDIMMPVMDGYQFRKEQVRTPALGNIPTVILSADGNVQQKAASVGVKEFLRKPVELSSLFALASKYCH